MLQGSEKATLIVGHFGSGKSEVAVNLALELRARGLDISLADLDLVNPYFRSREAIDLLESHGINVVVPPRGQLNADLPILVPQVRSLLMAGTSYGILDVGGDDVGSRVLGSMNDALGRGGYRVLMVINGLRPFSDTPEGCIRVMQEIEASARIPMTGLVSNAHMMEATDLETVLAGFELTSRVAELTGLPLEFVTAPEELAEEVRGRTGAEVLSIHRHLLPPWLREKNEEEEPARPKPLFSL